MSAEKLTSKLSLLQNKIKRDPSAYKDEFSLQHQHFKTEYELFMLKPSEKNNDFCALVAFLAAVTPCYPVEMADYPELLIKLVETHDTILHPKVRFSIAQCLAMMRNRVFISPIPLLTLFFKLFRIHDKGLRKLIFAHIISDITSVNEKGDNMKVNRIMQNFMFTMIEDRSDIASRKSLDVIVELYSRRIWIDARTINVLSAATLSEKVKVSVGAMRFFLGIEEKLLELEEEKDEEKEREINETQQTNAHKNSHSRKTKSRLRIIEKQKKKAKSLKKKLNEKTPEPRFPAIELIYDPQSYCEKLFKKLRGSRDRFEMRLMMMNLISRCVGHHKLLLLNFYSFLQRYLTSHQASVTEILAFLVQSCHELIPAEELVPLVKAIANNFVTDRNSPETIAVGLNAIREVFRRTPLILEEEGMEDLVHDLVQYQSYVEKGVRSSARSMINMLRETFPEILRAKDRGKFHVKGARPAEYGLVKVADGVAGADLLAAEEEERRAKGLPSVQELRHGADMWDVEEGEEGSDDEGDWVDVEEDEEEGEEEDAVEGSSEEAGGKKAKAGKASKASVEAGSDDEDEDEEFNEEEWEEVEEGAEEEGEGEEDEEDEEEDDDGEEDVEGDQVDVEMEDESGEEVEGGAAASKKRKRDVAHEETAPEGGEAIKKPRIDQTRVLTPADFERIKELKKQFRSKAAGDADLESDEDSEEISAVVTPGDLESEHKKRRRNLEERLAVAKAGRSEFKQKQKGGGTTNREKLRKKNFSMVKKSDHVRDKLKRSLMDQQTRINKRVKAIAKEGKRLKRRRTGPTR